MKSGGGKEKESDEEWKRRRKRESDEEWRGRRKRERE